jgi:hypothetical protein
MPQRAASYDGTGPRFAASRAIPAREQIIVRRWCSMFRRFLHMVGIAPTPSRDAHPWRCPICIIPLDAEMLEWRCPEECSLKKGPIKFADGPRMIREPEEQSCACPVTGCFVVHTAPFVKGCRRPLGLKLRMRDRDVHHVVAMSLHGDGNSLAALQAGLLLGEEIAGGGSHPVQPTDVPSRQSLDRKARVRHSGAVAGGAWGYVGVRRSPGDKLLYVHHFGARQPKNVATETVIDNCLLSRLALGSRIGFADTLALAITTQGAIERRDLIREFAEALRSGVEPEKWGDRAPTLLVVLTDEEQLARRVGANLLPGLVDTPPEQRSAVLDGYVFDGLQLRKLLDPLRDVPWRRISAATMRMPLDEPSAIAGLTPWFEMIGPL